MALIYWPSDLPQRVLRDGYRQSMPDGRIFSKMDRGPPKSRRRSSANPAKVEAKIVVPRSQLARFDRFWNEETEDGSLPFVIPDQIYDGAPLLTSAGAPLLTDAGAPLLITAKWLVKFDETTPSKVPMGTYFAVSFALVIYP